MRNSLGSSSLDPVEVRRGRRSVGAFTLLRKPGSLWRFLRDPAAPKLPRLMAVLAVLYLVMPFDVVTDALPLIGWLDDAGVMGAVLAYVASQAARYENQRPDTPAAPPAP